MSRKTKAAEFVGEGYNMTITGRNLQVTDAMKRYAMEKISKLNKFNLNIADLNIIMDIQKIEHRCDIIIKLDHILIKGHGATEDMYASIDMAVDRIQSQIRKYRERIRDHQARGVSTVEMNVNVLMPAQEELLDVNMDIDTENQRDMIAQFAPHAVVKKEKMPLKTLTNAEAVMKMELSLDHFMLFRSEEDRKLKVIYRRDDGNFGIIEPEC